MLATLFILLVVLGFILWFCATLPGMGRCEQAARLCFAIAASIWALQRMSA